VAGIDPVTTCNKSRSRSTTWFFFQLPAQFFQVFLFDFLLVQLGGQLAQDFSIPAR